MRNFEKHDYLTLCNWLIARGKTAPEYHFLPPTGLILDSAACGFLIRCDNNVGILDFFTTNPDIPMRARLLAVDEVAACLIDIAKRDEIKLLKCDTQVRGIKGIAEKFGFQSVGIYESLMRRI